MNTPSEEPTRNAQAAGEAELAQAHGRLHEDAEHARPQTRSRPRRSSRRTVLTTGFGVAAVASVGAGALLELSSGTAAAHDPPKPGVFASSTAGVPAVKATGTNGADGVDASSDSGVGVAATSSTGTGVAGTSTTGGTGVSGSGTPGVSGTGTGPFGVGVAGSGTLGGVVGSSGNVGVVGQSTGIVGGIGVHGINANSGSLAGKFDGHVQVNGNVAVGGNLTVSGTKSFVQAHPTDPSREIVYVALEGGEAGTYVRGSGHLQRGKAVLALPEHFGLVTDDEGLTVQLTPRGEWLQLYVAELATAQLVVREAQGKSGTFDYLIHGVRRGYAQHEVIRTKREA